MRRSSNCFGATMSMSWSDWWWPSHLLYDKRVWLPTANPRLPSTPATAHAARWWPLESSRRPHRQTRLDEDKGNQKRRRRRVRKTCASKVVCLAMGQHVKGMLARGPRCDRNMARELSGNLGQTAALMNCPFNGCVAQYCHPRSGLDGSSSGVGSGRRPLARSSQTGAANPASIKT